MDNMSLGRVFWNLRPKNSILTHLRYVSCWSCGINNSNLLSNLFCPHCKALQKPDNSENYFRILGVKETYDLDEVELAKKYKDLQKYLHPDKFGNRLVLIFFLYFSEIKLLSIFKNGGSIFNPYVLRLLLSHNTKTDLKVNNSFQNVI